jgi:hypothetical protein
VAFCFDVRLWIKLVTFLAQEGSCPQNRWALPGCSWWAVMQTLWHPQTIAVRKPLLGLNKSRLSTKNGLLYYYCYLNQ